MPSQLESHGREVGTNPGAPGWIEGFSARSPCCPGSDHRPSRRTSRRRRHGFRRRRRLVRRRRRLGHSERAGRSENLGDSLMPRRADRRATSSAVAIAGMRIDPTASSREQQQRDLRAPRRRREPCSRRPRIGNRIRRRRGVGSAPSTSGARRRRGYIRSAPIAAATIRRSSVDAPRRCA